MYKIHDCMYDLINLIFDLTVMYCIYDKALHIYSVVKLYIRHVQVEILYKLQFIR